MLTTRRSMRLVAVLGALLLGLTACGDGTGEAGDDAEAAGDFPEREITFIVRGSPGGGHDAYGRAMAELLEEELGQTVIVENMTGGAGVVAAEYMRESAEPDGYTVHLMDPVGLIGTGIAEDADFTIDDDFDWPWLGTVTQRSTSFAVAPDSGYDDWETFVEALQAGGMKWALTGFASPHVYNVAILFSELGIPDPVFVPHESTPDVFTSLARGDSDFAVQSVDSVISSVQAGEAEALIHFNEESMDELLPGVPSGADVGLEEYDGLLMTSLAVVAVPGTPEPIVEILRDAMESVITSDELAAWADEQDRIVAPLDAAATEEQLREVVTLYKDYRDVIVELIGEE